MRLAIFLLGVILSSQSASAGELNLAFYSYMQALEDDLVVAELSKNDFEFNKDCGLASSLDAKRNLKLNHKGSDKYGLVLMSVSGAFYRAHAVQVTESTKDLIDPWGPTSFSSPLVSLTKRPDDFWGVVNARVDSCVEVYDRAHIAARKKTLNIIKKNNLALEEAE